jgi:hypothetical protein
MVQHMHAHQEITIYLPALPQSWIILMWYDQHHTSSETSFSQYKENLLVTPDENEQKRKFFCLNQKLWRRNAVDRMILYCRIIRPCCSRIVESVGSRRLIWEGRTYAQAGTWSWCGLSASYCGFPEWQISHVISVIYCWYYSTLFWKRDH